MPPATPTEYVYVIGSPDSHTVKVGRSADPESRIAAIQTMSPVKLTVLWRTEGGAALEAALHRRFVEFRSHGEWFDFPGGDGVARVQAAVVEVAAEQQEAARRRQERRERRRKALKDSKIRKVWRKPSKRRPTPRPRLAGLKPGIRSYGGFRVGEVVRLPESWPYAETGIIAAISKDSATPFAIDANDGLKHDHLALFSLHQIAHQDEVIAIPKAGPCRRRSGCMCANVEYGSAGGPVGNEHVSDLSKA